jgi:glycosyltransferase involved in cell wall biosynthesis
MIFKEFCDTDKQLPIFIEELLTIVIPCKNEQEYIAHLLNDLSTQTGIGGTKIIIADSSSDKTRQIINANKGHLNISIIDGGPVSIAKNNGAALSATPYILFIDSDVRFFRDDTISYAVSVMVREKLDLVGARMKCYDGDFRTHIIFFVFNITNLIMSKFIPFAVGAFMLTRKDVFDGLGGFPALLHTSEDFHLSKMYNPRKFRIINRYFGQDSRRFRKMGYLGMIKYTISNFFNRNNIQHWLSDRHAKYWS